MNRNRFWVISAMVFLLSAAALLPEAVAQANVEVIMNGLDNPRGLAFGPEGGLYVVEAGRGGDGPCIVIRGEQLCYGPSGAVSRFLQGEQERIATGLPSLAGADGTRATGPHDISFHGRGGAYVGIGVGTEPNRRSELGDVGAGFGQLVRLAPSGRWRDVADVAQYEQDFNPDGGAIDSNLYGVLAEPGGRVVTDAGGNSLLRVAANGDIELLGVFPSRPSRPTDAVPTCVAIGPDDAYYVGELSGVPFAVGAARIYRVVPGEEPEIFLEGFTTIIDIAFAPDGTLYVLQIATEAGLMGPGALIRVDLDGTRTTIAREGLIFPTSVVIGRDGELYVSNRGIFPGVGEVLRIIP